MSTQTQARGATKDGQTGHGGDEAGSAKSTRGRTLLILAGVPFLMVLGNSMLFPVFPKLQTAIGVGEMQTSLLVTAFSIPAGLLIPVAGYLSDRFGRRVIMAPGVAVFGLGALIAALSSTFLPSPYVGLIVGRVVQGIGAAGMSQLAMAMAADLFGGNARPRALGSIEAANGLGKVVSPVAGGAVGLIAWFVPFYIFAALSLPLCLALWVLAREPKGVGTKIAVGKYVSRITSIFANRGRALGSGLLAGAAVMFLLFGTLFFLSETLETRFHMPQFLTGLILAIPVAAMSGTSYLNGLFLARRQPLARAAVLVGLALLVAVMGVLTALHGSRPVMYVAISFLGLGGGLALPALNLLITSTAGAQERGLITSLYGAVRFFGVALGPPTFGVIMKRSESLLFGAGAAVAGLVLLVAFIWLSSRQLLRPRGGGGDRQGGERRPRAVVAGRRRRGVPAG